MEEKQVTVRVTGNQFYFHYTDTSEEPIEVISAGTMTKTEEETVVTYEEAYEGFPEKTTSTVILRDGRIRIDKQGVVTSSLVFENGKKSTSYYTTPFGMMEMGVTTTSLRVRETADGLDADIAYALIMSGSYVADCTVRIEVRVLQEEQKENDRG